MFKRLRENIFGRPEGEEETEHESEVEAVHDHESEVEAVHEIEAPETTPYGATAAPPPTMPATTPQPTPTREDRVVTSASPAASATPPPAPSLAPSPAPSLAPSPPPAPASPPLIARTPAAATPPPAAAPREAPAPAAEQAEQIDESEELDEGSETPAAEPQRRGLLRNPFRFSLGRTRQLFGQMSADLEEADEITDDLWDELEETLITSDVGVQTAEKLLAVLRERVQAEHLERGSELRDALKEELEILLGDPEPLTFSETSPVTVVLVVGVNGVGKTTSIAKLAYLLKRQKRRVMLAAADTFRAAATEQLTAWGERVGVPVISHQHGADPGAVVYDAMQAAQARHTDVLIVDTAGRLHTKYNLMQELKKMVGVLQKYDAEAPHDVLLVIDATTGQNGFIQAKQFVQDAGVSGVILTKLDGTARGGIAFAIASELGLPIKYVGTGEQVKDIAPFDAEQFVDALFDAS